jgi:tetratricopeptide (TPR) repeat protein
MKKTIYILSAILIAGFSYAQMPDKFVKAMEAKIALIDSTHTVEGYTDLANAFERIAEAEKNQWLAYYYAAYCNTSAGLMVANAGGDMMVPKADKTDPYADKAEKALNKAISLSKESSEIWVVKKMIITLRMLGDVMNRAMNAMPEAAAALETAKKLDANNPRVYVLEGQDKFYTPEQFGGSKEEAKVLFEKAQKLYDTFKPETNIHPNWGKSQVGYFLSQYK